MANPQIEPCRLRIPVHKDKEETFDIASNDLFRPTLRQTRNSVYEIKKHFMRNDETIVTIPRCVEGKLAQLKTHLLHRLEDNDVGLLHGDVLRRETCSKFSEKKSLSRGLVFLANSLAAVLNFSAETRPASAVCDIFILVPHQTSVLVSIVDSLDESREMRIYNASIARGLTSALGRFLDEGYKTTFGILRTTEVENTEDFNQALRRITKDSSMVVTLESLSVNPMKYEKLLTAFWASVAETKSVLLPSEECIRFLTKEQCIVLIENINNRFVSVKSKPKTGATTLMLEVAQRVSRHDKTKLVCNSQAEKDIYQGFYRQKCCSVQVVTAEELSKYSLQDYRYIVGVTETFPPNYHGYFWSFTRDVEGDLEQTSKEEKEDGYRTSKEQCTINLQSKLNLEEEIVEEKEAELKPVRTSLKNQNSIIVSFQDINLDLEKKQDDTVCSIFSMQIADLVSEKSSEGLVMLIADPVLISLINQLRSRGLVLVLSWTMQL